MSTSASKRDPKVEMRTEIFVLFLLVTCGVIISMIFGTWGLGTTVIGDSNSSMLSKSVIGLMCFAAMLSINLNQFAKILETRPGRHLGHYAETALYYIVDWLMTFAGFGAWVMLFRIISGEGSLAANIGMGILIALAAVGAGFTSYGTEYCGRELLLRVDEYNGKKSDFKEIQKTAYSMSGWLALFVSWAASCFGIVTISKLSGADLSYAPNLITTYTAGILLPVIFSALEYWLLKKKDKSVRMRAVLLTLFSLDAATIFGGLGGIAIGIEVISGNLSGESIAILITAIISKGFTAYLGAVGAETAHVDAESVDEIEPDNTQGDDSADTLDHEDESTQPDIPVSHPTKSPGLKPTPCFKVGPGGEAAPAADKFWFPAGNAWATMAEAAGRGFKGIIQAGSPPPPKPPEATH